MKVFLAGDSLVQDYTSEEFIAGWGQYLGKFFDDTIEIVNMGKGGRSSRLFINEGRFDTIKQQISAGDYLFIEFCHNDDESKEYKTMFNRLVSLGAPDENGRYPVIHGEKVSKDYIPQEYIDCLMKDDSIADKEAVIKSVKNMFAQYPGDTYYPYSPNGEKGSYKWFLKKYADMALEKGAIPVFVTAPARAVFDENRHIKDGAGLHGGNNFCYIRAMKQLAEEMKLPLIDLFEYSKILFESIGKEKIYLLTSIKYGNNKGNWPKDFETELEKPETVSENTHMNKYGAFLLTRGIIELLIGSRSSQLEPLKQHIIDDISVIREKAPKGLKTQVYFVRHGK